MRTITHSEFVNGAGEGVYVSTVHYQNPAERDAGDMACQRVVVAQAFVPFGDAGEPFDPPEPWPSDATATEYAPQGVTPRTPDGRLDPVALQAVVRKVREALPPNCLDSGFALAHAQHEAAIDGDECTAGACLLTRGSD